MTGREKSGVRKQMRGEGLGGLGGQLPDLSPSKAVSSLTNDNSRRFASNRVNNSTANSITINAKGGDAKEIGREVKSAINDTRPANQHRTLREPVVA